MYVIKSQPSLKTERKEKEITIHYEGTQNKPMQSCPAPQTEDKWLNTSYMERTWTRLQHFMAAFLRAPTSMTVKIKHYFISMDRAFYPYTLLSMGQTEESK